ncbi:hypothetical protein C8R46DRAFT_1103887 [Mycena filopes]|nr:hypothetical protein C8R46DRAFT_1103887 [Mycena filopes]
MKCSRYTLALEAIWCLFFPVSAPDQGNCATDNCKTPSQLSQARAATDCVYPKTPLKWHTTSLLLIGHPRPYFILWTSLLTEFMRLSFRDENLPPT